MDPRLERISRRLLAAAPQAEDLGRAMEGQASRIRLRTQMGLDVKGYPFLRKRDGSPSFLRRTGLLMSSIRPSAKAGPDGVQGSVSVIGRARTYAPFVNAKRKFMGASVEDRRAIVADLRKAIRDRRSTL